MGKRRRIAVILSSVCVLGAARNVRSQDEATSPERAGAMLQAGAQDVPGGIEAQPTQFEAEGHLLGDPFGLRGELAQHGVAINPIFTFDYVKNLRGGRDTAGSSYIHQFDLVFTGQSEPLLGFTGGNFFADLFTQKGQSPSDETGDFALVDEIDYGGRTEVGEIWYEQKLLNNALRVKLGKIDANTEFCFATQSLDFSNGGLNHSFPNTQFQFMPTAADPAWGAVVFFYPCQTFYMGGGVFDGALVEGFNGDYGPATLFGPPADLYIAGEVGVNFKVGENPWRVGAGIAHHTGTFTRFDGGGTQDGDTGFYAVLDAMLWKENPADDKDKQGIGGFFSYDTADSDVTPCDQHVGGGLAWVGALPGRDDDSLGVGASYSHFVGGAGFVDNGELVIEGFYKVAVTKYLTVKADLQYITDPGGAGLPDALAALVRVQLAF
jgi:porin